MSDCLFDGCETAGEVSLTYIFEDGGGFIGYLCHGHAHELNGGPLEPEQTNVNLYRRVGE